MNKRVKNSSEERRMAILSARKALNSSDNRLKLVMCLLMCAVSTVSAVLIASALSLFAEFKGYLELNIVSDFISALLPTILILTLLLLAAPIYVGTYRIALMLQRGESAELSDVFFYYTSFRRYLRSLSIILSVVLRIIPCIISILAFALAVVGVFAEHSENFYEQLLWSFAVALICIAVFVLGVFASCRSFGLVTEAMLNSELPISAVARRVRRNTKGKRAEIFVFRMSFIMRTLLGILTVGVLLLVHTIPLAMISHAQYNETIKNS